MRPARAELLHENNVMRTLMLKVYMYICKTFLYNCCHALQKLLLPNSSHGISIFTVSSAQLLTLFTGVSGYIQNFTKYEHKVPTKKI